MKHIIQTNQAPIPSSPYSQAIRAGDFIYTCGFGPEDPQTGELVGNNIEGQTRQTLENIKAVLAAAGAQMSDVVKVTTHLQNLNDFAGYNRVYAEYFPAARPVRTTVGSQLLADFMIEIDVVAYVGK
ncbi:MAG: Rid family detoxifying hydrolase [Chloroflexota bacterium]|jgi:2-iminobutanoate/2-iminopropanoate deaminase|nr:Rid family detoxifying hydrolase [Chloroflexota bacterium]